MIIVLGQILVLLHQPAMYMLSQTTIAEGSDPAGTETSTVTVKKRISLVTFSKSS